tara:strand:- start:222 stop:506 length:285 start_codon:yes stop_codon:yes gene_type:complete
MNFKKYEKELNKAGYYISGDMIANSRGDVAAQIDPYGDFHCNDDVVAKVIRDAMRAEVEVKVEPKKKKKRARTEDGYFKADDKSTPDVNEAWEE